ncbi:hypothetical protein QBC46DRAFT_259782, partial [Diplogelasinospora grovesii]
INEDPTYVKWTAKVMAVEGWLKKHRRLRKTVYIIMRLKITKNLGKVTYNRSDASNLTVNLKVTFNLEEAVEAGGEASYNKLSVITYEEKLKVAYVFTYRLRKLKVVWRNKFRLGNYKMGGNLYGAARKRVDAEVGREDKDNDSAFKIESVSFKQHDFGGSLLTKDKKL